MQEDQVRQIAQEVYNQNNFGSQFTVSSTSFHTHNGTDSQRIKQNDVINGTLSMVNATTLASEVLIINLVQNINVLTLHGIAANGLGQKASITGTAQLGKCYIYNWAGDVTTIPVTKGKYQSYLQSCSSTYLDASDIANVRVSATGTNIVPNTDYIAYVLDNTGTVVASMQIIEWTGSSIKINTHLETNWYIKWYLSMS